MNSRGELQSIQDPTTMLNALVEQENIEVIRSESDNRHLKGHGQGQKHGHGTLAGLGTLLQRSRGHMNQLLQQKVYHLFAT